MGHIILKPYELLENILIEIEKKIREDCSADILAEMFTLSSVHLQRLFKFAFRQTIAGYIRSRKLAASIDDLLNTDTNVMDIALDYGFDYEQSYIRSFRREFGITPGYLRKSSQFIKIKPPLHLFDENRLGGSAFFGPDFVIVPQFHIIGKSHHMSFIDSVKIAPEAAIQFWENERSQIKKTVNPKVYIGLTRDINYEEMCSEYITSIQVENLLNVPTGYSGYKFETSMCARFRYIGQHHYYALNKNIAEMMYNAIWKFAWDEYAKYKLSNDIVYFERIDTGLYDGNYCQLEWFTPVIEKTA